MTLKEYLEKNNWANTNIPKEFQAEILSYTKVPKEDSAGRKWYKVYFDGTDSKYSSFMICPDTKERRSTSFEEFYGGAVVD